MTATEPHPPHIPSAREREAEGRKTFASLRLSATGLELGLSVVVGYGLGWYADSLFGSAPWGGIAGIGLGFTAGIRSIFRALAAVERAERNLERAQHGACARTQRSAPSAQIQAGAAQPGAAQPTIEGEGSR